MPIKNTMLPKFKVGDKVYFVSHDVVGTVESVIGKNNPKYRKYKVNFLGYKHDPISENELEIFNDKIIYNQCTSGNLKDLQIIINNNKFNIGETVNFYWYGATYQGIIRSRYVSHIENMYKLTCENGGFLVIAEHNII